MVGRALVVLALLASAASAQSIAGTVTQFKGDPLEMGVQQDGGKAVFLKVGADTEVVQVAPGERDLAKSKPAAVPDILVGDRVLVSMVPGMTEARRVILITARDIAQRNEAERLDWQKRGISGTVTSKNSNEVLLEIKTPKGPTTTAVTLTPKTSIKRYSAGSVKFADAKPSSIAEIETGDQIKVRGDQSEDGSKMTAQDIVFGTFLTKVGSVTAVNRETSVVKFLELTTNKALTIRLTKDSILKMLPDPKTMMFGGGGAPAGQHSPQPQAAPGRFDVAKLLDSFPVGKIEDLKVGGIVIVTSTKGVKSDELTAITILANADYMLQVAQQFAGEGVSASEAMGRMHGGMLGGPTGLSLPAMIP